jgi:hypothetical protein
VRGKPSSHIRLPESQSIIKPYKMIGELFPDRVAVLPEGDVWIRLWKDIPGRFGPSGQYIDNLRLGPQDSVPGSADISSVVSSAKGGSSVTSLWAGWRYHEGGTNSQIIKIDPQAGIVVGRFGISDSNINNIAVSPNGADLWVTSSTWMVYGKGAPYEAGKKLLLKIRTTLASESASAISIYPIPRIEGPAPIPKTLRGGANTGGDFSFVGGPGEGFVGGCAAGYVIAPHEDGSDSASYNVLMNSCGGSGSD